MSQSDWTFLNDGLSIASVSRGVTNGIARPNGGGNFVYGFNTKDNSDGAIGLHINQVGFNPMPSGMSLRGAIKRGVSGGPLSFAPMFFVGLQGPSVNDQGYLFGLGDGDPHNIILRKGTIAGGLVNDAPDPPNNGVLLRSTETFEVDTWLHLRVDMIVNGTGDVIFQCFENDLDTNPVTAPVWTAITGMENFVDDALGVNSGSVPFTSGRGGKAMRSQASTRRGFFDHIEIFAQQ